MKRSAAILLASLAAACAAPQNTGTPAPADATKFLADVNESMKKLQVEASQAGWVQQNFITDDTEAIEARVNQRVIDAIAKDAKDAVKYDKVAVSPTERRQLELLKNSLVMVTPPNPKEGEELTTSMADLK